MDTPEVGASGAIFGLFARGLILVRKLGLDPQWLIGIIVLNFVLTFSIHNISKLGHIGGFITGGLAAVAIAGLPRVAPPAAARRASWPAWARSLVSRWPADRRPRVAVLIPAASSGQPGSRPLAGLKLAGHDLRAARPAPAG